VPLRYAPRSLFALLFAALLAVSLPLALALIRATVQVQALAEQGRQAVANSARAARTSRQLAEQAQSMERLARQYAVLGDKAQLNDYATVRERFKGSTSELSLLPLDEAQLIALNRTIDSEERLHERLLAGRPTPATRASLTSGYAALGEEAQQVLEIGNAVADREVDRLTRQASDSEEELQRLLLGALLLGALGATAVALLVARPLRSLDAAIRTLGDGDLSQAVAVRGPADLERLGSRLEWLRQRLVEVEEQKTLFLRHVSHELKTPLTSLREGAELLADGTAGTLNEAQQDIAAILRDKSRQLQRLIEALLDYQRAHAGLGQLLLAPLDFAALIDACIAEQRLAASARQIDIAAELPPLMLNGDAGKLRTVVDNLLSNAIRYSPAGGRIALHLSRQDEQAQLEVCDSGPGVPPADRERIFDWFFRGGAAAHGSVGGSGLGLGIARELVAAHGGSLSVVEEAHSKLPGACFRLLLPLQLGLEKNDANA
jgi:two-component system sensor histidine kinase GlrK